MENVMILVQNWPSTYLKSFLQDIESILALGSRVDLAK
jgi:hypothetical protein